MGEPPALTFPVLEDTHSWEIPCKLPQEVLSLCRVSVPGSLRQHLPRHRAPSAAEGKEKGAEH